MIISIFNKIINECPTPTRWKNFYTLMIPEPQNDSHREISSWRPIALLDCIYKLFTTTITHQIKEWIIENDLNFPLQNGNGKYEGCSEHIKMSYGRPKNMF